MEGMREEGGWRVCLRCGKLMPTEASFCNSCGAYLKAEPVLGWQGSAEPAFFKGLYAGLPAPEAKQTAEHAVESAAGLPAAKRQPQIDVMSTASLICAIVSFVIPIIPAVAAISLGSTSRERIRESGGRLTGENTALLGIILGAVNIVIMVIVVIIIVMTSL